MKKYKYTDEKTGLVYEVSEDILNLAVDLKLRLQASSNNKCNWSKLVRTINEEMGYKYVTHCEGFRCLVKAYQRKIGKLTRIEEYRNLVADSKTEALTRLLDEVAVEKKENQLILRDFRTVRDELVNIKIVTDEIRDAIIDEVYFEIPHMERIKKTSNDAMIICLSDLHIGALVSLPINKFSYEVARNRLHFFAQLAIEECIVRGIQEVYVIGLGDAIENCLHGAPVAHELEFPVSKQIVKASNLIIQFITWLSEYVLVKFGSVGGNHDRVNIDKKANLYGDSINLIITEHVNDYIDSNKDRLPNLSYLPVENENSILLQVNGKNIVCSHGDKEPKDPEKAIARYASLYNVPVDALLTGHIHHYSVREFDGGKLFVSFGSLKGCDNYTYYDLKLFSEASQGIFIVSEDGQMQPMKFSLQSVVD